MPYPKKSVRERLLAYSVPVLPNGCWEWQRATMPNGGYGRLARSLAEGTRAAHRISYEEFIGPIPEGLVLDHLCNNTGCINPLHLEPVTQAENVYRIDGNLRAWLNAHLVPVTL
jgi:hypothetical protein